MQQQKGTQKDTLKPLAIVLCKQKETLKGNGKIWADIMNIKRMSKARVLGCYL